MGGLVLAGNKSYSRKRISEGSMRHSACSFFFELGLRVTTAFSQSKPISEVACRVVCVVHAIETCILSAISNLAVGPWVYSAVGEPNTPLQSTVLEISLGYFLFDLVAWCIAIENESTIMLVHRN